VPNTTTVMVGAGHCGLAMSHCLAARSVDHVVLERGQVANSWRTQPWDSLRLLTPNWMTRLPGFCLPRCRPGRLPQRTAGRGAGTDRVTVTSVRAAGGGYLVGAADSQPATCYHPWWVM
jgi:putative flavoprotein involved in K+ transport